jgi:hypothetical protein
MLYLPEIVDRTRVSPKPMLRMGGVLGFVGGFLMAYQRSSCTCELDASLFQKLICIFSVRFWGWSENKREEERDFEELSQRAREGKPLYGESHQPEWVQGAAHRNSAWSALKFSILPMFVQFPSPKLRRLT